MKKSVLLLLLILSACMVTAEDDTTTWQKAYSILLREYFVYNSACVTEDTACPLDDVFITTKRINENMPLFTFYHKIGDYTAYTFFEAERYTRRYVSITIVDENGNLIQIIDGIAQGGHSDWMTPDHELFQLRFDDLNFDGYLDIRLITAINPGTARGEWAYHWLWKPELGKFVSNEQLNDLSDMNAIAVNYETSQIEIHSRGGGAGPG